MNNKKAFTLVEMLGVVAILAIISLFTFPLITSLMRGSSESENEQFLKTLYSAAEVYIGLNYDKFETSDTSYISTKVLATSGLISDELVNPVTKERVIIEDGIIEITRNIDNSFKYEYVLNQYVNIYYIEDLIDILSSSDTFQNKTVVLTRNLDINEDDSYENINSSYNGTTIKNALTSGNLIPKSNAFKGTIKGNNHTISNITIYSNNDNVGLFSLLDGATISDINLDGVISGKNNVGLLAGTVTNTTIKNMNVETKFLYNSSVTSNYVGGVIGKGTSVNIESIEVNLDFSINGSAIGGIAGDLSSSSMVKNIIQMGYVNGNQNVGGIVGSSQNTIFETVNSKGKIYGSDNIGGIIGNSSSDQITGTSNNSSVSGTNQIGGIIGNSIASTIENSYASNNVSGTMNVGGIVGYAQGSSRVLKTYSLSAVSGNQNVGGIVGNLNTSYVENCYSNGNIISNNETGGLIGNSSSSTLSHSYYSGTISASDTNKGGLIGLSNSSTITSCYYNLSANDFDSFGSSINDIVTNVSGKSITNMQKAATYSGWDFTNIWQIREGNYPSLR